MKNLEKEQKTNQDKIVKENNKDKKQNVVRLKQLISKLKCSIFKRINKITR